MPRGVNHEGTRMGTAWCSRGRPPSPRLRRASPPRILLKPGRPKAVPNRSAALTADFADVADEEATTGLTELPDLLFQATRFVMRSRIAPCGFNHGWTRIHTDELGTGRLEPGSCVFCASSRPCDALAAKRRRPRDTVTLREVEWGRRRSWAMVIRGSVIAWQGSNHEWARRYTNRSGLG